MMEQRKMSYTALKAKQQEEFNQFPFGFAFSKEQFTEMMQRFGLNPDDTDQIYSIGNGGYVKRTDSPRMHAMLDRQAAEHQAAIAADQDGTGYVLDMFLYEMQNHEYCITLDPDDTLEALNLTMEQVEGNSVLYKAWGDAEQRYFALASMNGWY